MKLPPAPIIDIKGIRICWPDGHRAYYPHWYLRAACPCADCLEGTGHGRLEFYNGLAEQVRALDWRPVGQYAIEFLWSDGHETGAYALETLRRICRCRECVAKASSSKEVAEGDPVVGTEHEG